MPLTKEERREAYLRGLELTRNYGPYVLQRRSHRTGEWKNVHLDPDGHVDIEGHEEAMRVLGEAKCRTSRPDNYRVLPKNEADKFREGIKAGKHLAELENKTSSWIPPSMYMPDNL